VPGVERREGGFLYDRRLRGTAGNLLTRPPPLLLPLLAALLLGASAAWGQSPLSPDQLKETVKGTLEIRQDTQNKQDGWEREKAELEARYRSARAHLEALRRQQTALADKDRAADREIGGLRRRLAESERLEAGVEDLLGRMMADLEAWVRQDLPFLPEEREARLASLRETLAHPGLAPAEKLRRLFEALQVECEYGNTVEVYQQGIEVEGEPVFAEVLRLGTLSLFWQTPDGKRVGEFDRAKGQWLELPSGHRYGIRTAVEIARKRRPVELVTLPLGRISP